MHVGQVWRHGPSSYLYLLVALNISVYPGDIQVPGLASRLPHAPRCVALISPRAIRSAWIPCGIQERGLGRVELQCRGRVAGFVRNSAASPEDRQALIDEDVG